MNIVVIHGQTHKGSTYHLTKLLVDEFWDEADEVNEFSTNHIQPCTGCLACITKDEELCPHRSTVAPMIAAIEQSDLIMIESPNYCMEMTGQLKIFFDHMAYRWISHRPHPAMKHKIGVALSTTAGMGAKGTTKSIARQLFYWGVAKTFCIPFAVHAANWNEVDAKRKAAITKKIKKTAQKIKTIRTTVKPGLPLRFMFSMMRAMQKKSSWNPVDRKHWEDNGWL